MGLPVLQAAGPPGRGGSSPQQAYLQCLQSANTPADLQKCASLSK